METPRKIQVLAMGLGIFTWVLDGVLDAIFFYPNQSFLGLLLMDVPAHELYIRLGVLLLFVSFGFVVSHLVRRMQQQKRDVTLFRRLVDEATDSLFVIDPTTGEVQDVNQTACEALGYDRSTLLNMTVADINQEFDDPDDFREFLDSPQGANIERYETAHRRADGSDIPVEVSASTVTLEGRSRQIAIARNISDREERKQRVTHYKQAIESSRDLLTALDDEFRYLFANEAYCSFYDIDHEEITGMNIENVVAEDVFDTIEPHLEDALAGEQVEFEITRTHATQGDRILDVRYFPLRDASGDIHGVAASLRDVTDRNEMVEDLRKSRKRYESLFNSIRDAILVADTDGNIVDCNPAFTDLFGYSLAEIEGQSAGYLFENEEEFEAIVDSINGHIEDTSFTRTIDFQKRSGQVFPGETNVFYRRDHEGEIIGYIGLVRDVSERIERITQIQTIDRILRHNLTNALTVIYGNAEMIEQSTTGTPKYYAERILDTGEDLRQTSEKVREITSFLAESRSKIEQDPASMVETVVANISNRHPDADITVEVKTDQSVLAVEFFEKAIEELVENAVIYSDRQTPSVTITIKSVDRVVEIAVADDGPGIPDMERKVLTGEHDIEPLYHGSGIGLWLVHLIVQHSDGTLEFDENDPQGSIVRVRLPATDGETE